MFCRHCGTQLEENAKFCPKCGNAVENTSGNSSEETSSQSAALAGSGTIIKIAWQNYKSKFWKVIALSLLGTVPFIILTSIAALLGNGNQLVDSGTVGIVVGMVIGIVLLVALIVWMVWTQGAIVQTFLDETPRSLKETLVAVKPKIRNYFWASVISALISMLGFFLFIIPGIIFAVWFSLSTYVAIAENTGAIDSVRKSKAYVSGQWWKVFGRGIVFLLLVFVIYIPVIIVLGIVASTGGEIAGNVVSNIFAILVTPFFLAFGLSLYRAVRAAKGEVVLPETGRTKYIVFSVIALLLIPISLLSSVVLLSLNSARVKSRDAKRAADVRQIQTAAALYYNDFQKYPANLNELSPNYLAVLPTSPVPAEQGCTEEENAYNYELITDDYYKISFCLGTATGGFDIGVNQVTQEN